MLTIPCTYQPPQISNEVSTLFQEAELVVLHYSRMVLAFLFSLVLLKECYREHVLCMVFYTKNITH
jgi:hypothetical protein